MMFDDRSRPPRRGRAGVFFTGLVLGAAIALASVTIGARNPGLSPFGGSQPVNTQAGQDSSPLVPAGAPDTFSAVYEKVSPAVVSIYAASRGPARLLVPVYPFDGPARLIPPQERLSSGSGFFISPEGYVVTNNHVVEGASEILIALSSGERLPAVLVGRDPPTDIAVLKVEGRAFPYVNFSRAARPKVGDWVIAVGNPFGLGTTATAGIVSAYGRDLGSEYTDYLQLDAAINRGNSGGPSFDAEGRVVGVNTAIFSPTGSFVGIGFAIPADVAAPVTERIIREGQG